ncbi:prostaglandin reductase 1-like [Frankliniella occidentalis]|uniref:Prostaglandin reductase 1-like n=1 Tax=Frankliniella occidentalis TaxID=133901 RepID=A0A9C6WZB7_FRAOC|nr:prostaglandin reductase 1-like [Frankliniella occidentalis]
MIFKELTMQGFVVTRWYDRFHEAEDELYKWIKEGKINVQEHPVEGFDNLPNAFIGLLRGENTGKVVVKV